MRRNVSTHAIGLRIFHGIVAVYFTICLVYLYFVGLTGNVNKAFFILATVSLAIEGVAVFVLNQGNCPLIHIQRKIGDHTPFFELLMPARVAKWAIPFFAVLTVIAVVLLLFRFVLY